MTWESSRWRLWPFDVGGPWIRRAGSLPWLRTAPFALFVVCILAYGAAFAWYMLAHFDLVHLLRDVNYDDAFYYFQIAYHMAEGRFSTFDGGLTRTNGYHPLWLFLLTPFYWMFDKTEALFAVKVFEIMLVAGGVALAAAAARTARQPWVLLFAVLPALYAPRGMLAGLEAALGLFTLTLLLLVVCLFARDQARWRWPLAAVVFALPWVRLEYVAIAVAVSAALCFLEWSARLPCAPRAASGSFSNPCEPRRTRLRQDGADAHPWRWQTAVPLAAAIASVLVYFVYNGIVFGGIVPVSGAVKEFRSQQLWNDEGGYSLAENFDAFARSRAFDDELLIAFEMCGYALLVWWLSRRCRTGEGRLLLAFMVGVVGLAAGHLAKFVQSVLFMHPTYGLYDWYFVPAYLMNALVVPVRCFVGIYVFRCILATETRRASDIMCLVGGIAVGVALLAKTEFSAPFRFVDARSEVKAFRGSDLHSYSGTLVLNRLLPKNTLVGSWDSGVVGYFAHFPVMNLDGLANTYDYKQALDIGPFDRKLGLSYVANLFRRQAGHYFEGGTLLLETHAGGHNPNKLGGNQFRIFGNSDVAAAWDGIASYLERQADGTGLLVSGRIAQAFAEECGTTVAEWSFADKVGAISHWTQTVSGCASAIVLPREYRSPLRVRRAALGEAVTGLTGVRPPMSRVHSTHPGGFDVHLVGRRLIYVKEDCERADVETTIYLHLRMIDDDSLGSDKSARTSHANHDFLLEYYGGWDAGGVEGPCLADVPLPRRPIAAVRTGQQDRWEVEILVDLERSADGIGSFIVQKEARAFAMKCAASDAAVWTYGRRLQGVVPRRRDEKVISVWTRTADGSCTSDFELPLDYLPPVRVRRLPLPQALAGLEGG